MTSIVTYQTARWTIVAKTTDETAIASFFMLFLLAFMGSALPERFAKGWGDSVIARR
jgi:hypothetical protein